MTPAPDVVGPAEARALLGGISRTRFDQLRARPHPVAGAFPDARELEIGNVYDRAEVIAWQQARTAPRRRAMLSLVRSYRATGNLSHAARTAGVALSTGRRWLRELEVPLPSER